MDESKKDKIISAIKKGRAYYIQRGANGEEYIYLPKNAFEKGIELSDISQQNKIVPFEKAMVRLFNNCTIEIAKKNEYVEVIIEERRCRREINFQGEKRYVIIDGKIYSGEEICEQCQDYLKNLINECSSSSTFKWKDNKELKPKIAEELWQFEEMKKGYVTRTNFDDEIYSFTVDHVIERIEEFEDRGRFVQDKIQTEGKICQDCIKYKTKVCNGLSRHNIDERRDAHCKINKENFSKQMEERILSLFGSMGKALWYFTQCGQEFHYKDPNTKKKSKRYISLPGSNRNDGKINGFQMSFVNYPLAINSNTHNTFISEKEFREHEDTEVIDTRYAKKYYDVVIAAEAYRKEKEPGEYIVTSGHTNYLAYARIGIESYRWAGRKTTPQFIIGAQTSSNSVYPVFVEDVHELLKETWNVKDLRGW